MLDSELGQHGGQLAESPADDHAIRPRANSTNASAARVGVRPAARDKGDLPRRVEPIDARGRSVPAASSGSIADREMNVDAVAGLHGALHGLLQAELEPDVEVAQANPERAQLVLDIWRTPAPSCMTISVSLAQLVERDRPPGERGAPAGTRG